MTRIREEEEVPISILL